nr:MAG TPA: hypothetical protein [Caudoviricetes sp.]
MTFNFGLVREKCYRPSKAPRCYFSKLKYCSNNSLDFLSNFAILIMRLKSLLLSSHKHIIKS